MCAFSVANLSFVLVYALHLELFTARPPGGGGGGALIAWSSLKTNDNLESITEALFSPEEAELAKRWENKKITDQLTCSFPNSSRRKSSQKPSETKNI